MHFTLIALLLSANCIRAEKTIDNLKAMSAFFYTMPKTLVSDKNETVCLSTHSSMSSPTRISVDLKLGQNHYVTSRTIDTEHSCFELRVPSHHKSHPQSVHVKVHVVINGVAYSGYNQDPVMIYPKKKFVFVDTDRHVYKSEDFVRLRVLSLKENLLPETHQTVGYLRITNPLGVSVVVWKNLSTDLGLVHLKHQLSRDSIPGKWKIEADGETKKTFEVNKYVLPRFKVVVSHPKTIYFKSSFVAIKVCAKYSYGAIVKGTAFIRLSDSQNQIKTVQELKKMSDGCADFTFSRHELSLDTLRHVEDHRVAMVITATVTEEGTDKIELTTAKSVILFQPYSVKFAKHDTFLPGLPYHGTLLLTNVNIDLAGEVIEICYNLAINKSWNYLDNEHCSNYTVDNKRGVHFHVLPLKSNVIHFQLHARSLNQSDVGDSLLVVRIYSPSLSYIDLEEIPSGEKSLCRSAQQFSVQYSSSLMKQGENVTFFYMIKSRNQIVKMRKIIHTVKKSHVNYTREFPDIVGTNHKHTKLDSSFDTFILKFRLEGKIFSNYQLLVYYGTNRGEIVSAVKEVKVGTCLTNEIKANWSHKQIVPGGTASLLLETKSDSLCSISAVDKATTFINGVNTMTLKAFLAPLLEERETVQSRRKPCVVATKRNKNAALEKDGEARRRRRYIYSFSEDYDAYDMFNKIGVVTITNFKVVTKPCYIGPPPAENNPEFLTDQYDIQSENSATPIRSFFPETWLWELFPVRNAAVIHRNVPHSITTWTTSVVCLSPTDGLGVSYPSEITTFQPFFVQVLTPFSVKRKETLYLHVIVFNYLTYNIPIRVSLDVSHGLSFLDPSQKKSVSYCVLSNNTVTHVFELRAVKVEKVNVTVVAELDSSYPGECGPDILINKRDVVFKTFLVEPEGYSIQSTKSALLCGPDSHHSLNNITWRLKTPKNVVPDTLKTELLFSGDIVGQAVTNLDKLIAMPTGCGEQIMATLAPNLHILKYLNATKSLSNVLKHKIVRNLKIGYQRILNYAHKDGSFSAFGYHDPSGSMFLTAFVVRVLEEAKLHIYVDQRVLDRAVAWIVSHQLENGCFNTMLHVFQDMGGTSFENSTAGLTSYVMISLLRGSVKVPEAVQTNAKYCIRSYNQLDKYTLAISAYALLQLNWSSEANRMLKKLLEISAQKDNMLWWSKQGKTRGEVEANRMLKKLLEISAQKDNMLWWSKQEENESTASDIETTSYVLLALLHQKNQDNLAKAHSIVRWLTAQQGAHGGFKSTQDTVVALSALTKYASMVNHDLENLHVRVNTDQRKYKFTLNKQDRLKSRRNALPKDDTNIAIQLEGTGCVLAQITQSYFIESVTTTDAFKLNTEVLPLSKLDECSIVALSSCFSYTGPDLLSNMAILEVNLPSGYEADRTSLYKLIDEGTTTKVKMFEEIQQKIVLYLTKLTSQPICINFVITENVIVHSKSNYTIKLYDYYKPEYHIYQFYRMNETCRGKNSTIAPIS